MRQQYETEEDRKRQRAFADYLERAWHCIMVKAEIKNDVIDYEMLLHEKGNAVGWCEIKCRFNASTTFPTYMISLQKWEAGIEQSTATGKPFVIAVHFLIDDRRMFFIWEPGFKDFTICFQGRTIKTRDIYDEEYCVFIPMKYFREVKPINVYPVVAQAIDDKEIGVEEFLGG